MAVLFPPGPPPRAVVALIVVTDTGQLAQREVPDVAVARRMLEDMCVMLKKRE